jgi:hypothetical protein
MGDEIGRVHCHYGTHAGRCSKRTGGACGFTGHWVENF